MKTGDRVKLINPNGYDNFQGTLKEKYYSTWWHIEWDLPYHPCTSPMEEEYLELIPNKKN